MTHQLEKFDSGPVYYLKSIDETSGLTSVEAIINIQEIKDHAKYYLNIVCCKNYDIHNVSLHGSYLNIKNVLQIATNILTNNADMYSNIVKTSDL